MTDKTPEQKAFEYAGRLEGYYKDGSPIAHEAEDAYLSGYAEGRREALEWVLKIAMTVRTEGEWDIMPSNDDICRAIMKELAK